MTETRCEIRTFISNDLLQGAEITNDENLLLSGRLDSLSVMTLVSFLESTFEITVPFDEILIENFETVDAMSRYLGEKLAER